jgi:uncharacterized protein (TIGR03086 family)
VTATRPNVDPAAILDRYHRASEGFTDVLSAVHADQWDQPSLCEGWTLADVVGHVVWGQRLARALATDDGWRGQEGAPGAPHPAVMLGADPFRAWRAERDRTAAALTGERLARIVEIGGPFGTAPLGVFIQAMATVDIPAHTADVGFAAGIPVQLDPELVRAGEALVRAMTIPRNTPGGFKSALTPPADADAQTQFLAFLGRRTWSG